MLKVNIDGGKDYLEYLRPFILDILSDLKNDVISDEIITGRLLSKFGLEIPRRTVQVVLQRIKKSGVISKSDGCYKVIGPIPETSIIRDKAKAERHISSVVEGLIRYFSNKTDSKRAFNEEIAIDALLAFLSKFSIPCLKAYLRGTTIPHIYNGKDWKIILVSQYIQYLNKNDPERFESFITLAQGNMLANALLCPDLKFATKSYSDVIFYLDTPLLLQLLGLEGEPGKQAVQELLNLIFKLDGKVACFSHTRDELEGIIKSISECLNLNNGRGAIVLEARRNNITKSDFLLMVEKIDDHLDNFNLSVIKTPRYIEKFQISESDFAKSLNDEVSYHNPKAREYDINSVRSIYVLRSGTSPFSIEKCKAVLVTSNTAFSKAAYEFGKNYNESREISSVITDFSLANTAWLKAPLGAPSLPQKEVLAFAYAGLNPSQHFWERILAEAEKLEKNNHISARDHQLLRSSTLVQDELMKLTLGEEDALTEQTITEAIQRVTEEIKLEETIKLSAANKKSEFIKSELDKRIEKEELMKKNIYWNAEKLSKREAKFISVFLCFLIVLGVVYGVIDPGRKSYIVSFISFFIAFFSIFSFIYGTTIMQIHERMKNYLLTKRLNKKQKELGINFEAE